MDTFDNAILNLSALEFEQYKIPNLIFFDIVSKLIHKLHGGSVSSVSSSK